MPDGSVTVVLPCLERGRVAAGCAGQDPARVPRSRRRQQQHRRHRRASHAGTVREVVTERRPGYGSAVHAGIVAATTPIVAVLDADGSLDPAELPLMVAELDRGADMVIGSTASGARAALAVARPAGHRGGELAAAHAAWPSGARHRADAGRAPRCAAEARYRGPPIGVSGRIVGACGRGGVEGGGTRCRLRSADRREIEGQRIGAGESGCGR